MEKLKALSFGKKIMIGAVLIGISALGIWQYQQGTSVSYYEVGTRSVEQLVHVNAEVLPNESAWYTAQAGGILMQVSIEKDGTVKKEDVLYSIQPFDFIKKQTEVKLAITELTLLSETALDNQNKAVYTKALLSFDEQNSALEQAWIAHNSVLELFKKQMITSDAYKESLLQINTQLVKYMKVVSAFNESLKGISSELQAFEEGRKNLENLWSPAAALQVLMLPKADNGKQDISSVSDKLATFKAVKDGRIARITAETGMYVPLGAPLLEIANPELAKIQMEIPVEELGVIKAGTEVRTKLADGTVVKGKITFIDKVITDQMQTDGSIVKLVKTFAVLDKNKDYQFYSKATASIVVNFAENAVVVPKELVFENKGKYSVWVNENGILTEKSVVVSFETEEFFVIKNGVKPGALLVMDTKLNPGQKIK